MKSIYDSAKGIMEGNYTGKEVPRAKFNKASIAPAQPNAGDQNTVPVVNPFPSVRGSTSTGGGAFSKIKSAFSRAAELEKSINANELPSVKSSKVMGTTSFTSPPPVVKPGPTGSEKIPADASVPAYIRQNKPEPTMTDKPSASQKAKDLMDKMDQMQQQGIGQEKEKPKVSADFYKNLKAAGMKTANESRMSSAYSVIKRILGEASSGLDSAEQKELDDYKAAKKSGKPITHKATMRAADLMAKQEKAAKDSAAAKPQANIAPDPREKEANMTRGTRLSPLEPGKGDTRGKVTNVDLTKKDPREAEAGNSRGNQNQYLQDKGLKGNEEMKKQLATPSKPAPAAKPAAAAQTGPEKSGPDLNAMKSGIASGGQSVQYGLDQKSANAPLEAKREAEKQAEKNASNLKPLGAPIEIKSNPTIKPVEVEPVKTTNNVAAAPNAVEVPDHKETKPAKPAEAPKAAEAPKEAEKPQANAEAPKSSSEFQFSADQEKWLGKANRQDPYILARMPGNKPPIEHFTDPKDQKIAKKIGYGISNANAVKGVFGAEKTKSWGEEKVSNINKKFNVTDALYQSVMEVMKKDKKEGSVPRNDKEKELAAAYGDPKRITHGDVLKMRGVTKEEVAPKKASPGWGKDDYKPLVPDTEKPGSAKVSPAGSTTKPDPKGKMKPSSGDPEGVKEATEVAAPVNGNGGLSFKKREKDIPQATMSGDKQVTPPVNDNGGVTFKKRIKENKDTPGNGYAHQCAVHVKSESFGEGRTITTQHADPDASGNIAWYDVMFEHGIERYVPTDTLEILVSEMHMHSKKKKGM